jgi:hypothetical protein
MQRRVLAAAIALLCANTVAANAQLMPLQDDPSWGPRIRVTPFVGYLPSVTREETWIHNSAGTNTFVDTDYRLASGTAIGLNGEIALHGPWSAMAGVMYGSRGSSEFDVISTGEQFQINGSRFLFARAGASLVLREKETELTLRRLSASVFAAPFYMREMPRSQLGFANANVFDPSNHFGLSIGATGELPFAKDRMTLQVGVEDYATLWSEGALRRLPDSFFNDATAGASTRVETDVSHQRMIRAGLSYRWR